MDFDQHRNTGPPHGHDYSHLHHNLFLYKRAFHGDRYAGLHLYTDRHPDRHFYMDLHPHQSPRAAVGYPVRYTHSTHANQYAGLDFDLYRNTDSLHFYKHPGQHSDNTLFIHAHRVAIVHLHVGFHLFNHPVPHASGADRYLHLNPYRYPDYDTDYDKYAHRHPYVDPYLY